MRVSSVIAAACSALALGAGAAVGASPTSGFDSVATSPLTRMPGTPAPIVDVCRTSIIAAARPLDAVEVDAVSAGPAIGGSDDVLRAPLEVRIVYAREDGQEVRQSLIECQVNGDGDVIALVGVPGDDTAAASPPLPPSPPPLPPRSPPRTDEIIAFRAPDRAIHASGGDVVTAFYRALGAGDGRAASGFVIPEKRSRGPLSADEMSRYFGSLSRPLRLERVEPVGSNLFAVRYSYEIGNRYCAGAASVTVTAAGAATLIESIAADETCS